VGHRAVTMASPSSSVPHLTETVALLAVPWVLGPAFFLTPSSSEMNSLFGQIHLAPAS
jgi:hypothetical protein